MSKNPLNGDTALHEACRRAHWPVVSWLIAAGADPEVGLGRGAREKGERESDIHFTERNGSSHILFARAKK